MNKKTFIVYNADKYESQEEAIEAQCATEIEVDMDDSKSVAVFEQMELALGNEAGHCVVEEKE